MKTEIRLNGSMKIILTPIGNIEKEIFKELFSGGDIKATSSINGIGEVIIERQEATKQIKQDEKDEIIRKADSYLPPSQK